MQVKQTLIQDLGELRDRRKQDVRAVEMKFTENYKRIERVEQHVQAVKRDSDRIRKECLEAVEDDVTALDNLERNLTELESQTTSEYKVFLLLKSVDFGNIEKKLKDFHDRTGTEPMALQIDDLEKKLARLEQTKRPSHVTMREPPLKEGHRRIAIESNIEPSMSKETQPLMPRPKSEEPSLSREQPMRIVSLFEKHSLKSVKDVCEITSGVQTDNGRYILADKSGMKVLFLDTDYKVVQVLDINEVPRDLCRISVDVIAVSLESRKVRFIKVGRRITLADKCLHAVEHCYGISCVDSELFVLCTRIQKVRVFNINTGIRMNEFTVPRNCAKITSDGDGSVLFLTGGFDITNYIVHIFDKTGQSLHLITHPQMSCITGCCSVDRDGTVFVYDLWAKKIFQVTREGEIVGQSPDLPVSPRVIVCDFAKDRLLMSGGKKEIYTARILHNRVRIASL